MTREGKMEGGASSDTVVEICRQDYSLCYGMLILPNTSQRLWHHVATHNPEEATLPCR